MRSGIYLIRNLINNKCYIGKFQGYIISRINQHLAGKSPGCKALNNAVKKYGKDNFAWEILYYDSKPEFLHHLEKLLIRIYKTKSPNGYNLTDGAGGIPGYVFPKDSKMFSEETKHKRSESLKKTFAESPEIWFEAQRRATEAAAEVNRGQKRPSEIRNKISIGHRKPDYEEMHDYFLSLPTDMHLSEKTRLLREKFPAVKNSTLYFRIRQWTDIKGKKQHPAYPEVHKFFLSLPADMPLPKKRHLLQKEFPNIRKYLLNRWLNKWSGTKIGKRYPDKVPARELFLSLPANMVLSEKRSLLREKFPNVKRGTLNKWTRQWKPSELKKETSDDEARNSRDD